MRLKDRNRSPVGGFVYKDEELNKRFSADTLRKLVDKVVNFRDANGFSSPSNIADIIEDQICMRQPPDRCWYEKKVGDQISRVIHATARVADNLLGTNLEQKARGCGGCGGRRMRMNK